MFDGGWLFLESGLVLLFESLQPSFLNPRSAREIATTPPRAGWWKAIDCGRLAAGERRTNAGTPWACTRSVTYFAPGARTGISREHVSASALPASRAATARRRA